MSSKVIPDQSPVQDMFDGLLLEETPDQFLSTVPVPEARMICQGRLLIRYGLRFQGKIHQSIVPGLVVLDYGDMLTGEEAWEFLLKHSNLHPRAEVVGHRDDGREDIVFLRTLDFGVKPCVLVYEDDAAIVPVGRPTVLLSADTTDLPHRLIQYLDRYVSMTEWQRAKK